jgi:hypothetical protein
MSLMIEEMKLMTPSTSKGGRFMGDIDASL